MSHSLDISTSCALKMQPRFQSHSLRQWTHNTASRTLPNIDTRNSVKLKPHTINSYPEILTLSWFQNQHNMANPAKTSFLIRMEPVSLGPQLQQAKYEAAFCNSESLCLIFPLINGVSVLGHLAIFHWRTRASSLKVKISLKIPVCFSTWRPSETTLS